MDQYYNIWYQCKFPSCTHLFYNEEVKMLAHLRDKHGFRDRGGGDVLDLMDDTLIHAHHPTVAVTALSNKTLLRGTPLKIKEQHFRPVTTNVPSTSSGTDGDEEAYAEDIMNNNNNNNNGKYNKANISLTKRTMPRLFHKDDITNKEICSNNNIIAISQLQHSKTKINANLNNNNNNNIIKRVVPSIEELKKQLVNSDIDISEIKMRYDEEEEEDEEEDVEQEESMMNEEYNEDGGGGEEFFQNQMEGEVYKEESFDDQDPENEYVSEDADEEDGEGASTSNQSFYDHELGGHFLFKTDADSNYEEDDGIMTPNFGMVDELASAYRRASLAANASTSSSSDPSTSNNRRRTFHNPCKLCNKVFPSLSMLKKHSKTHLNEDGGSQHICKFCFDYFPSAASLSKHLVNHTEENPNVCQVCQKSFTSWATLRTHQKIHSGERPFACDECGQRFQTKSTLDSHLRIHSGSRPHICPVCFKRTSSPLYRHMRSVHKGLTMTVGAVTVNS